MKAPHLPLVHALLCLLLSVTAVPAHARSPGNASLGEETLAKRRMERPGQQGMNTLSQSAAAARLKRQIQNASEPSPAMKAAKARWDNARKPKPRTQQIPPRPSKIIPPGTPEAREIAIQSLNELTTDPDHPLLLSAPCSLCAAGDAPIHHDCQEERLQRLLRLQSVALGRRQPSIAVSRRDFERWQKNNEQLLKIGQPPLKAPWAGRPIEIIP